MGFKTIKGNRYYYRSRRAGGKVVSEYMGRGERAELFAQMGAEDRAERIDAREEERYYRDEEARRDRGLDDLVAGVQQGASSYLDTLGYHRPKRGVWRKQRCPK